MPRKDVAHPHRLRYFTPDAPVDSRTGKRSTSTDPNFLSPRTDLAIEAHQTLAQGGREVPGVRVETEDLGFATVTRTMIEDDLGAQIMGKAKGTYVTIQCEGLTGHDRDLERDVSRALGEEIKAFLRRNGITDSQMLLVVGLGNWNATPDNVGPLTISKLLVTRHLHEYRVLDEELLGKMRPLAALSPGVLGLTGIESAEIVYALVQQIRPAAVVCVDALASMSVERIGKAVQLSDAGINPGSGVGNLRKGLTPETLGVPVLAIGVPTVIYATTIVSEALDALEKEAASQPAPASAAAPVPSAEAAPASPAPLGTLRVDPSLLLGRSGERGDGPSAVAGDPVASPVDPAAVSSGGRGEHRSALIKRVLGDSMGTLIVTPKEIDALVETLSDVLADGLNESLHPGITAEEAALMR